MFTRIRAENFKSWRELPPTRLGKVTGFFGPNSSGKSSLLQLLLLLKQTSASTDRAQPLDLGDDRSFTELGSFKDVVFDHESDEGLLLGVDWSLPRALDVSDPSTADATLFRADNISFNTRLIPNRLGSPEVECLSYETVEACVMMERSSRRQERKEPEYELKATIKGRDYLRRTQGRAWPLPAPIKCYGFPDEASAYYQNSGFIKYLELEFDRQFNERTFYLGPLRSNPLRQYRWKGTRPTDVGMNGERAVEVLLASRESGRINTRAFNARGYATRRITVEVHVAQWLRELGLVANFDVKRLSQDADIYRVEVKTTSNSAPVFLTDVGFGVSQILPVLVLLAYVPESSTVLLEQPEIHLHPKVQSALADVILEVAQVRNVQVIVESHSEHLLRRLQRRVAEGSVALSDIALYFADIRKRESCLEELRLNLLGEIENWPSEFFGDPLGETAAITRAALKHRGVGA